MVVSEDSFPIDAVITWVDGNDPAHKAKRKEYERREELEYDDVGGDIRYVNVGEIKYCVASILRFASFVRNIYIVTDGQDPQLGEFIERNFPGQSSKIRIVDHKVIYRGYEDFLPVFNSMAIETVLWRIPNLSEHFIMLNDDLMFVAPATPKDFFVGDKIVCYATRFSVHFAKLLQLLKPKKKGHKVVTFKSGMVNSAKVVGERWRFFRLGHNPHAMRVSVFEQFFSKHRELMEANMSQRFRELTSFNPTELSFLLCAKEKKLILRPKKGNNLYLLPKGHHYMADHMKKFRNSTKEKFCCVNSLNYACEEDQRSVLDWLKERLILK